MDDFDYIEDLDDELMDDEIECVNPLDDEFIRTHFNVRISPSVIENFPFVEDDIDAITDYELFSQGFGYLDDKKADKDELSDYAKKDEIPDVSNYVTKDTTELENYTLTSDLSEVATTGDYNDLTNKPTIPDVSNFITKDVNDLTNYTLTSNLSTVATSGNYNDLTNKPTIPDVSNFITKDVNNLTYYTLTSNLSSVATSGNYNDLSNKPTIPTVPTDVSAFTNDAGYITKSVNDLTNYTLSTTINNNFDKVLKKNDASILADVTPTTITPSNGSNYSAYSNSFYYKIGTRVHIHLGLKGLTANTLQQVFDIPVGYRPNGHMVTVGQGGGSDLVGQAIIEADTHTLDVRSPSAYLSADFEYDAFS